MKPEQELVVGVHTAEVVPVLVVAAAEQRVVGHWAAAVVDGRQVVADRADVRELDILLDHALTTRSVRLQPTTQRCRIDMQTHYITLRP